jgi:hypothetical protein
MGDLVLKGATSGQITLTPTAVAGTNTLTVPAKTGNIITSADSGTVTQAMLASNVAGNGPAFMAYANASQTVTLSTWTKVAINTEETNGDPNSCFDTTNNRFTPNVAGYYQINGNIRLTAATTITQLFVAIYKNGTEYTRGAQMAASFTAGSGIQMPVSQIVYLNGSTDYVELWGQVQGSGTAQFQYAAASATSWFSGALVRAA